jgi:hypothetical protein
MSGVSVLREPALRPVRFAVALLAGAVPVGVAVAPSLDADLRWVGYAFAAAYAFVCCLVLAWLGAVADVVRTAGWQRWRASVWLQDLPPVGTAPRLAFYPVDAPHAARPVRSVLVLWDPALADVSPGEIVETSGDPRADAIVVTRHGGHTFWPVSVNHRENRGIAAAAPALGAAGRVDVTPGGSVAGRAVLRGAIAVALVAVRFALGARSVTYGVALVLALVPFAPLVSLPLGCTPRLRGGRPVKVTVRSRRLAPRRRTPWFLTPRLALAVFSAALMATAAVAVTGGNADALLATAATALIVAGIWWLCDRLAVFRS